MFQKADHLSDDFYKFRSLEVKHTEYHLNYLNYNIWYSTYHHMCTYHIR